MFGFLRGNKSLAYRQAYTRCCQTQHRLYGWGALPFVSFEGIWLYLAIRDLGGHPGPPVNTPRCCRLRTGRNEPNAGDAVFTEFAAALGMLLAQIKLRDDVLDDRSWLARFATWRLQARFRKARDWFQQWDPAFNARIEQLLVDHAALERRTDPMPLEEYTKPTAEAFGYVFSLASRVGPPELRHTESQLDDWGRAIGATIIAVDAAVDWEADRRRGRFNPLGSRHEVAQALAYGRNRLVAIGWQCVEAAGSASPAAEVLRGAIGRISLRLAGLHLPAKTRARPTWVRRVPLRWRRAGICDGCEILACGCEGCDCPLMAGVEGCASAAECLTCCEPSCVGCPEGCFGHKSNQSSQTGTADHQPTRHDRFVGLTGETVGAIFHNGMVKIDNVEVPARTNAGRLLDANSPVHVIAADQFGVIVEPLPPSSPGP